MPFPANWPPRAPSGVRSIRFYVTGTATANFNDNAWLFADDVGANNYTPLPEVKPGSTAAVVVPPSPWGAGAPKGNPDPAAGPILAQPPAMLWCRGIRIVNAGGGTLEFSFDGTNIHGVIPANTTQEYFDRFEAGICVRGASAVFHVEAW